MYRMKYYQILQSILYPVEFGCFFPDDVSNMQRTDLCYMHRSEQVSHPLYNIVARAIFIAMISFSSAWVKILWHFCLIESVYLYFVKLLSSCPIFSSVDYLMSKNILNKLITFSSHSHFTIQHYFRLIHCQAALHLDDAGFGTGKIL